MLLKELCIGVTKTQHEENGSVRADVKKKWGKIYFTSVS